MDFTDGQTLFALRVQDFTDGQTLFALRCAGYQNLPCAMNTHADAVTQCTVHAPVKWTQPFIHLSLFQAAAGLSAAIAKLV